MSVQYSNSIRRRSAEAGTVLVESAITMLMFFVVLFGIWEAGRFLQTQEIVTNAAREGARLAVAPFSGQASTPSDSAIQSFVQIFLNSAGIRGATVTITRPVNINTGQETTQFTQVKVQVPYQVLTLSMFSNLQVTLEGQALMRNETSP